ncbi:hypothetical protein [Collinsella aerofaciens]|uniref:hypothetical protein n=1 Tax=Collinsella aerofaciens TaxID=74426 RepID=UPI001D0047D7|nr:hypothetical protein [Collinsella aerofaciens]MCB5368986.1 hypothetical protein [Collinsella aerofaciens]
MEKKPVVILFTNNEGEYYIEGIYLKSLEKVKEYWGSSIKKVVNCTEDWEMYEDVQKELAHPTTNDGDIFTVVESAIYDSDYTDKQTDERLQQETTILESLQQEIDRLKGIRESIANAHQDNLERLQKQLTEAQTKAERYEKALKEIVSDSDEIFGAVRIAKQALEETE